VIASNTLLIGCSKKINGWKEKLLSLGGKEILIKAIAIPVFAMTMFNIPKKKHMQREEFSDVISKFLWGDDNDHRRMHWKAW
jgi:hypothetical protein